MSLNTAAVSGSGFSTTISTADINYVSIEGTLNSLSAPDIIIQRTVEVCFVLVVVVVFFY